MGCCPKDQFLIYRGSDRVLPFVLRDKVTGLPVDLTGASEIQAKFPQQPDGSSYFAKTLTGGSVSVPNPQTGYLTVTLSAADTAQLNLGTAQDVWIHVTISASTSIIRVPACLNVAQPESSPQPSVDDSCLP